MAFEWQLHLRPLIQNVGIRCLEGRPQAHALSTKDAASSDICLKPQGLDSQPMAGVLTLVA